MGRSTAPMRRRNERVREAKTSRCHRVDESPAGSSLVSCSPAGLPPLRQPSARVPRNQRWCKQKSSEWKPGSFAVSQPRGSVQGPFEPKKPGAQRSAGGPEPDTEFVYSTTPDPQNTNGHRSPGGRQIPCTWCGEGGLEPPTRLLPPAPQPKHHTRSDAFTAFYGENPDAIEWHGKSRLAHLRHKRPVGSL